MNSDRIKYEALKTFWQFDQFREPQEQIIDSVLAGRDTLALLPTGGGKSLCYQLPAVISEGTCLVISPLLALMRDQVAALQNIGIEAELLSSELDERTVEEIFFNCKQGITKLLYVSPERITNKAFLENLEEIQLSFIAVDEAHCISEWGQDFRPSYQNIKKFREEFANVPCLAVTATATPTVLDEIQKKLGLVQAVVFQKSFLRQNLSIQTIETADKREFLRNFLRYSTGSGIIYTRTRSETEELHHFLSENGIPNTNYYHAGLDPKEKILRQNAWTQSKSGILISTNAFGMGIDKDNVRFVIHYSPPASIENYYQEIGRAGRDGNDSTAILLWNDQDLANFSDIIQRQIPDRKTFNQMISYVYSIHQVAEGEQREDLYPVDLQRIKNFTKATVPTIRNVLNFLHNQEIIFLREAKNASTLELKIQPGEIDFLSKSDAYFTELLLRNFAGIQDRRVSFNENTLSQKIGTTIPLLRERLRDLQAKGILDYLDGLQMSVKFLVPRNSTITDRHLWPLFEQIQRNKMQKWEEMKFFTRNGDFCKTKFLLTYFGERPTKNCGRCSTCLHTKSFFASTTASDEIKQVLGQHPAGLEEIAARLSHHKKQTLLEHLILLLDAGEVAMQDFRTYRLA